MYPTMLVLLAESGSAVTAGISTTALNALVNVAFVLSCVTMVVRGMVALWLYRDTAAKRIRAILARWQDEGSRRAALNALGGTSIGAAICYGLRVFSVFLLILIRFGGPKIYAPLYR